MGANNAISRRPASNRSLVTGVLLAGGQSRRMGGGDKCLLNVNGSTLLQQSIERARPQVAQILISVNGDVTRFGDIGLPLLVDDEPGYAGPLAGILTAMQWVAQWQPHHTWLASFATDTPRFPRDLVPRLLTVATATKAQVVYARCRGRDHYAFALWAMALRPRLRQQFAAGQRALHQVIATLPNTALEFDGGDDDPFFNINTPTDLQQL